MRPPSPNPLPTPRPGPNPVGLPPKVLAGLAAGVVIAHAVVLQLAGNAMEAQSPLLTRPFITRAVAVSRTAPNAAPDTTTKATATSPTALAAAPAAATTAAPPAAPPRPRKRVVTQLDAQALAGASAQQNSALPPLDTAPTAPPSVPESAAPTPTEAAAAVALEPAASAAAPAVSADPVTLAAAPSSGPAPGPPSASAPAPPSASTPASPPASPPATPTATPSAAKPPAAAVAFTVPGSVRLRYKTVAQVGGLNWDVSGELLWLQDGTSYNARLQWTLFGVSKVLTSTGRIGRDGLLPTRFGDKFRSSEVAAHFERDKQKVVFSANTPELPLLAGMQDQLSVFVQMGAMLGAAPAKFPRGTQLAFETVGPRAADTWVFVVDAEEKLSLPGGEMATLKLVRGARREFDQTAELWLAPSLGYLPVRLKISERNGDFVDQQWRSSETP